MHYNNTESRCTVHINHRTRQPGRKFPILICRCWHSDTDSSTHSTAVAVSLDGYVVYGLWESAGTKPVLDACNGHIGEVPTNAEFGISAGSKYHYHTTDTPPYTLGYRSHRCLYISSSNRVCTASGPPPGPPCPPPTPCQGGIRTGSLRQATWFLFFP